MTALKNSLRAQMLKKRDGLDKTLWRLWSDKIYENLLAAPCFAEAKTVMTYVSFRSEPDTHRLINAALSAKKQVFVPVCQNDGAMAAAQIFSFCDLSPGRFGILEPTHFVPPKAGIDLCLVPGSVFDLGGGRIGYGRGFYDRFLRDNPCLKIGLCFSFQILEAIPQGTTDVPLDGYVTEKGVIQV